MFFLLQLIVYTPNKRLSLNVTEPIPVFEKKMVIENIECNAGKSASLTGEHLFAGKYVGVLVGKAVDRPMMSNALLHGIRECREIDTPGKVTEDAPHPSFR
jgi:hypothetical protein